MQKQACLGLLGDVEGPLLLWPPESGSQSGLLTGAREFTVPVMVFPLYFLFLLFLTLGGPIACQCGYRKGDL